MLRLPLIDGVRVMRPSNVYDDIDVALVNTNVTLTSTKQNTLALILGLRPYTTHRIYILPGYLGRQHDSSTSLSKSQLG
jgi:hypothetical protein